MEFGDLIASNYNSFLVGIVHSLNEGGTSVLRIFDSKDSGYLESYLEINPQRLITDKIQVNELSKKEGLYDDLEKDYQKIFIEAVALIGVPMHASIINIIKCFLQATGRCKKAILLISPPGKNIEMSFIVLCILSKNSDKQLFLKDLSSKASEIFKDEKVHTQEVDVFYRAPCSSALGSQTIEAGKQVFLDDSESNPCPVCLERLIDSSNPPSLFTMLCQHTFHASCLLAWGGIRCPLCRRTHTVGHSEEMTSRDSTGPDSLTRRCQVCATSEDIFVCLGCGYEGCGKSKQGHAMVHAADMHHQMGLQVSTNSVYDLNTFCPIYNLTVKPCAEKPHTHSESSSLRDGGKEKHFEEIRMLRAQLVSQSHHFNALLQETDETHQQLLTKLERLNKDPFMKRKAPNLRALRSRIAIQKASNQELEAQIKSLKDSKSYYLERGDALAAQLSKDKAELHQLSSTSLDLEKELASRMKLLS